MRTEWNFRQYTKAGFAFIATTATYFLARTTGMLPTFLNWGSQEHEGALTTEFAPIDMSAVTMTDMILAGRDRSITVDPLSSASYAALVDFKEVAPKEKLSQLSLTKKVTPRSIQQFSLQDFKGCNQTCIDDEDRQGSGEYTPISNLTGSYFNISELESFFPGLFFPANMDNPFVASSVTTQLIMAGNTKSSNSSIFAYRVPLPRTGGAAKSLNFTQFQFDQRNPTGAFFPNEQIIMAWDASSGIGRDVYVKCFSENSDSNIEFKVNTNNNATNWFATVATLDNSFTVAWVQNNGVNDTIYARFFDTTIDYVRNLITCNSSLASTDPIEIASYAKYAVNVSVDVAVMQTGNGNSAYYFVWGGENNHLYIRPFSSQGVPFQAEFSLGQQKIAPNTRPLIAAGRNSQLLTGWQADYGDTDADVSVRVVLNQGTMQQLGFPVQPVIPIATSPAYESHMNFGVFSGGNFVVVWHVSQDSSNSGVGCFESCYCPTGLYARFFQADQTPLISWNCISDSSGQITSYQAKANLEVFSSGDFVLLSTEDSGNLNSFYYSNQPPSWDKTKIGDNAEIDDKATIGKEYTKDLSEYLTLYGTAKDPEGGTVTCVTAFPNKGDSLPSYLALDGGKCVLTSTSMGGADGDKLTIPIKAMDPEGQSSNRFTLILTLQTDSSQKIKDILASVLPIIGSVILSYLSYQLRQYRLKQYREFQHPFASEVHAWLNLQYADFTSGPGQEFARLMTLILQIIKNPSAGIYIPEKDRLRMAAAEGKESGGDAKAVPISIEELRKGGVDGQVRYYFYAMCVAKAMYLTPDLMRDTEMCGVRLIGFMASQEIQLSTLELEAENIVRQVSKDIRRLPPEEEWAVETQSKTWVGECKTAVEKDQQRQTEDQKEFKQKCCAPLRESVHRFRSRHAGQYTLFRLEQSRTLKTTYDEARKKNSAAESMLSTYPLLRFQELRSPVVTGLASSPSRLTSPTLPRSGVRSDIELVEEGSAQQAQM